MPIQSFCPSSCVFNILQQMGPYAQILQHITADVTGGGYPQEVYLLGAKQEDRVAYYAKLTLVVTCVAQNYCGQLILPEGGYSPRIFVGDLDCDAVDDILVSADTGGSGGTVSAYAYSFRGYLAKELFNYNTYYDQHPFTAEYTEGYRVRITDDQGTQWLLDISCRGSEYLSELYNPDGTLKQPVSAMVLGVTAVLPLWGRDCWNLQVVERIAGKAGYDTLGYIQMLTSWDGNEFIPYSTQVSSVVTCEAPASPCKES